MRFPTESGELTGIQGVPAVVVLAVGDGLDERVGFAELPTEAPGDFDVFDFVAAGDVIGLTGLAMLDEEINRVAMILDINPIADLPAVAVEGERLVVQRVGDEEGDEFLDVLVGAEVVGAAGHDDRYVVSARQ